MTLMSSTRRKSLWLLPLRTANRARLPGGMVGVGVAAVVVAAVVATVVGFAVEVSGLLVVAVDEVELPPPPQADIKISINTKRQSPAARYLFFIFNYHPLRSCYLS